MTKLAIVACLAALAIPTLAGAQQNSTQTQAQPQANAPAARAAPPEKSDPNKLICHTETPVGSNLKRRICKTQAQLDAERLNAQRFMEQTNVSRYAGPDAKIGAGP